MPGIQPTTGQPDYYAQAPTPEVCYTSASARLGYLAAAPAQGPPAVPLNLKFGCGGGGPSAQMWVNEKIARQECAKNRILRRKLPGAPCLVPSDRTVLRNNLDLR